MSTKSRSLAKTLGLAALGLLLMVALAAALIWVPQHEVAGLKQQMRPAVANAKPAAPTALDVFQAEDRARQTLATIVGGFLVLVGAYMTWRNVLAAERNAKIAEDKQLTDRFTAAVTNLSADGPEKMAVRLGGIYALERIARDSPNDHWAVMEVLTAYVRDKCPAVDLDKPEVLQKEISQIFPEETPVDIQAILTVIGRRKADQDGKNHLDLRGANLARANLEEADLRNADLREVILVSASLRNTQLQDARMWHAKLQHAKMWNAKLAGAELLYARLGGAYLESAILEGANLSGANFFGADLLRANLKKTNLCMTDLRNADLREADVEKAVFNETTLAGATLGRGIVAGKIVAEQTKNLTQQQLDSAQQGPLLAPHSLPPGLTFPGYTPPDSAPAAPPPPAEEPPAPPV